VIGVTLRVAPTTVRELRTLSEVLRQTINIALTQNEERNRSMIDIEILVDLGNRNSLNFEDTKPIIEAGYRAAAQNQDALARLSVSPAQWDSYLRQRASRLRSVPDSGRVVQVSAANTSIAKSASYELTRKVGDGVSIARLEQMLRR